LTPNNMFNKVFFAVLCLLLLSGTVEAKTPVRTQSVAPQRATDQIDSFYIPSDAGIGNELRGKFSAARALITKKDYALADSLLDALIKEFEALMVDTKNNRYVCIRYDSDYEQFLKEEAAGLPGKDHRPIIRVHASFSRALQLKGWIAVDQKEWVKAIDCFKKEMLYTPCESDQYVEMGFVASKLRGGEGFGYYKRAYDLAEAYGNNTYDKARALRGMGGALIDIKKLDEANAMFEKSLDLELDNKIALRQIDYIKVLKVRNKADSGDAAAQFELGLLYSTGTIVPQNDNESVKWFRLAAEQGLAEAQRYLGNAYAAGEGVEQSYIESIKWTRLAAEQGDAIAQYHLGIAYTEGQGVQQGYEEAVKWFRLAADQGLAEAQYNMGYVYSTGDGVPVNQATAIAWYQLSADKGFPAAQGSLGAAYAAGNGVEKSSLEAVKWSRLAAEQGDCSAQYNLGIAYAFGQGVQQSKEEAVKWFRLAADQGLAEAQYNLGVAYSNGKGVKLNKATAKAWYKKACANGYKPACDVLKNNF